TKDEHSARCGACSRNGINDNHGQRIEDDCVTTPRSSLWPNCPIRAMGSCLVTITARIRCVHLNSKNLSATDRMPMNGLEWRKNRVHSSKLRSRKCVNFSPCGWRQAQRPASPWLECFV